jgi:hypothetical protein
MPSASDGFRTHAPPQKVDAWVATFDFGTLRALTLIGVLALAELEVCRQDTLSVPPNG